MEHQGQHIAVEYLSKILLAGTAASVAESLTFPLDLCKARLHAQGEHQLDGSHKHRIKRGMINTARVIVRKEGFFHLWSGLSAGVCRQYGYSGTRVCIFETVRDKVLKKSKDDPFPPWKAGLLGLGCGTLMQFLCNPADLMKVQMQLEGKLVQEGKPRRYTGILNGLYITVKRDGFVGLWRGWPPNVTRAGFVNLSDFAAYSAAKHQILKRTSLKDNWVTHFLSGWCSGLAAALTSTPADVIKTRTMNQPVDQYGRGLLYTSPLDCLKKTLGNEGFFALYKGFVPYYIRMAPWFLTFWITYEQLRRLCGKDQF